MSELYEQHTLEEGLAMLTTKAPRLWFAALAGVLAIACYPTPSRAADDPALKEQIRILKQRIDELNQQVDALAKKQDNQKHYLERDPEVKCNLAGVPRANYMSLPFQIVQLYQGIGNGSDPTTAYNWAVVTFNNQRFRAGGTGVT